MLNYQKHALNTCMMKFFLVVMMCWGSQCETVYEQKEYASYNECMVQAEIVMEYAKTEYPNSVGMVNCLNQKELQQLNEYLYKSSFNDI